MGLVIVALLATDLPQSGHGINDNIRLNHAIMIPRRIIFLTYPGAELLDLSGPASVFSTANRLLGQRAYETVVASAGGGEVAHSCGIELATVSLTDLGFCTTDTVLVIGADTGPLTAAMRCEVLRQTLQAASSTAERYGSICTGVFVLAATKMLSGKSVSTHWSATAQLTSLFPDIRCNVDALYSTDGNLWTSAGVTTGIDMALAMLEQDQGAPLKASVARQLVVYSHRPGHQSQFSDLLAAQAKEDEQFAGLITWLRSSTASPMSVEDMADHVGMSPRTFNRRFKACFGQSPGKFFETVRLDAARNLLEADMAVADVALQTGFRSESAFRTAFKASLGITPRLYRETWK
jgi:transcriptional regulator GlxA family with amidase domain